MKEPVQRVSIPERGVRLTRDPPVGEDRKALLGCISEEWLEEESHSRKICAGHNALPKLKKLEGLNPT